jgi:protein dithiol oxidoreductase (disulfide-forming)
MQRACQCGRFHSVYHLAMNPVFLWTRRRWGLVAAAACWPLLGRASSATPEEGFEYLLLEPPVPAHSPGRIEVLEFFRYGCPFCDRLEPLLQAWKRRLPADVAFRYVPVSFHSTTHQQLYLTLQHLGEEARLRSRVYDAIHRERQSLEMLMEISAWAQGHGIAVDRFEAAWHAPEVQAALAESDALVKGYGVTSVPQFGVQGRFRTSPAMVSGSNARALEVVDHLVARVRTAA